MENNKIIRLDAIETGTLDFDLSAHCFITTWEGFTPSYEFRLFLERSLEWIKEKSKEHGKVGWVADISRAEVFNPEDAEWAAKNWDPKAYKLGIRYFALIVPKSVFAKINAEDYTSFAEETGALIIKHFDDLESAKGWLREVLNNNQ